MNFAPYQSDTPESNRGLSPPLRSPNASPNPATRPGQFRQTSSLATPEDPWAAARGQALPSPSQFADRGYDDLEGGAQSRSGERSYFGGREGATDVFETSLGMRMELEAALPYILLPPAGGLVLLLFEHKSDYVRLVYHRQRFPCIADDAVTGFMRGSPVLFLPLSLSCTSFSPGLPSYLGCCSRATSFSLRGWPLTHIAMVS